jgi:hypothetical protein
MHRLMIHLRIPNTITHPLNGVVFTGEECFLVWLYHMTKVVPFTEMAYFVFGRDPHRLSENNEEFISYAYNKFYNKISGTSLSQWIPNKLDLCRYLICSSILRGAIKEIELADGNVIDQQWVRHQFEFESFHVFCFLGDFAIPTACPGNSPTWRLGFDENIQRAFYLVYLQKHRLKAQVLYLPIGVVGSIFVTEIQQNDNVVLNMSNLNEYL